MFISRPHKSSCEKEFAVNISVPYSTWNFINLCCVAMSADILKRELVKTWTTCKVRYVWLNLMEILLLQVHFFLPPCCKIIPVPFISYSVLSSNSFEQCVSSRTERLTVPLNSPASIVFIWMLFQAKPGTGLDFRSPKSEPREPDSSGKVGTAGDRAPLRSKTNPNIRGFI